MNSLVLRMIVTGLVRCLMIWFGAKLAGHGIVIGSEQSEFISRGTEELVGYCLAAMAGGWSVLAKLGSVLKMQVALRLDPQQSGLGDVREIAKQTPLLVRLIAPFLRNPTLPIGDEREGGI